MIVYCRQYDSDAFSKAEYERFAEWSATAAPTEVSAWRTRPSDEENVFHIVVVDETDDERSRGFDWHGTPYVLSTDVAAGFIRRRLERLIGRYLAGEKGRATEKTRYGAAAAPRLDESGVWHLPPPRQG